MNFFCFFFSSDKPKKILHRDDRDTIRSVREPSRVLKVINVELAVGARGSWCGDDNANGGEYLVDDESTTTAGYRARENASLSRTSRSHEP